MSRTHPLGTLLDQDCKPPTVRAAGGHRLAIVLAGCVRNERVGSVNPTRGRRTLTTQLPGTGETLAAAAAGETPRVTPDGTVVDVAAPVAHAEVARAPGAEGVQSRDTAPDLLPAPRATVADADQRKVADAMAVAAKAAGPARKVAKVAATKALRKRVPARLSGLLNGVALGALVVLAHGWQVRAMAPVGRLLPSAEVTRAQR